MPSSEPHPPQYHLQHRTIPPSHLQQHSSSPTSASIGQHQLYQQLVAVHHTQNPTSQQHGVGYQNSAYALQKQEMSPEEEGGRSGGSPPAAGAALHQPHHPRTASPPSGAEPCNRDAIPTPTPTADTTTTTSVSSNDTIATASAAASAGTITTTSMQSSGQTQSQQQGPSPSPSPTGGDVEKFDGKIVYNPDGSAYIIEGESELSEDDSLPDGCIVDGRGVSVPHSLVFPQIASAYYVSRLYAHQAYQQQQAQQQQRNSAQPHNPDLPVMHSYRVISYRTAEGSKAPPPTPAPPPPSTSVPVKPILMCFICKLSFGYAKSFVAHAQGEHQLTLMEDERQVLSHATTSAIIQTVGRGKQPLVSFLESVTSSSCPQSSPVQSQSQQRGSESNDHDVPTAVSTPTSTPGIPSSPQAQSQRPSPSTPTTPTSHTNSLNFNHQPSQHQWTGQVSAASWAKAPEAMHYTSPPPPSSTKGSPSSYAALTQQPPNFLTGTTIGVCPEHMQGRPSGVECPKCELILTSSRLAGPGGPLAGIHSRNSCKTLKCPKCNWHYKYQETLEIHMKEKHPESETSCIYCIAGQPHPRLARGETYTCGYKPYRCEVCNYSTTTKGNLSIHMQSDKHLNNMQELQQGGGAAAAAAAAASNPSSSQEAPMPTRSPHHQQNHSPHLAAQTVTQGKPKPTFRCDVCNYETNVARNLRIHMTSEKHTHNMLVLQQNVKHMQTLSALQSHHQQAQQHHHQAAAQQQQLEQLLHLGGLDKPQHAEAALADMAYNQALLIHMVAGGQLPPQLPPELLGGMASMSAMSNLAGDIGVSPDSMEPPPEPADPDPTHLYHCCVCNNFSTDSLDALGHHLATDRTRTREGEILALVAGNFVCKLCSYKTNLKANFQLHCKTDKHLQRLQHVNHVKEGGPRNEWKLKFLASPTSAQLRCHACDYYINSAHKLVMHADSPRHQAAALLLRHLLEASANIQSQNKLYHCALCGFSARHRLPLLQHVRSVRHLQMEQLHQLHRRSGIQGNDNPHTDIGDVFQVVADPDAPSTQQASPTTPTTPNAATTNNERREDGSDCGSEVKQEPENDQEQEPEPENETEEIVCPFCTYQPTSKEELKQHLQVAHTQEHEEKMDVVKEEPVQELLCPLCQDGFKERAALEKHVMQIHSVNADGLQRLLLLVDQSHWLNNSPRNTSTPAATPTSPSTTKQHLEDDNERTSDEVEEITRCTICGRICRSLEELQQHHRESHPATTPTLAVSEKHVYKYRCGQCSLAFKTFEKLQQHSQYHAIRDATKCALCGRSFRSVQALQRHLETAHADLQEDEVAQYKQSLLNAHPLLQALTDEAIRRQSGVVGEQNVDEETRGDEEESDASDSPPLHKEQRLLEDYLNSQAIAEDSYQDPQRRFKCHRCKVAFTRQSYLTGHNKTLLHRKGEKMTYPMEKYLDPNRPYKCDVCKESFTQKNILLVHYNSVSHLHKHKRAMQEQGNNNTLMSVIPPASPTESPDSQQDHDKKPYKCNICKVAYTQGSTLDIHMRSVLHQTRASKLPDLAASGQLDLARPLIEQPPPSSPNSPPGSTNTGSSNSNMLPCPRCSALFVNQEQLTTHQQLYCIFSNPLALFQTLAASQQMAALTPDKTPSPISTTPGPQQHAQQTQASNQVAQDILSQPRHKTSQMYKHLLESFGFDLVMQFNENHQRRQRKEEEDRAALQAQQEQQKQEQQAKQALAAQQALEIDDQETEEHGDEEVIPELTRSTCQHCNKEFSSVWVLKAHCEEVHRDLVPREFLEKYAQQFKCEYEKKSVVVTAATSSSTTTAPRSSTPAANQPQDLSSDKEKRDKDKEESTECKERASRTPEATSTTPATTPALSNTPVSSTESVTPIAQTNNSQHSMQSQSQSSQQQQQQHAQQMTLAQQMSEMQAALNAMAASQLQQQLQQYPGLMMGMMGLPLGLNVPALAAMNLQPPLVPMMLPPPPYDGSNNQNPAYPPMQAQADLLAKQHLALQQQQAAAASAAASQKRARTRITDDQLKILRAHFDINNSPGEEQIVDMAKQSGLPPKVIKHWFRNTLFKERQRNKDSPYNFNNPPSTSLNLEEYEKTGEAKVTPLNSSTSGGSSSDDKSPNKQSSPPPSTLTATTTAEIKQEPMDSIPSQQMIPHHQMEEPHHSPGSSGGQQSRPHSPALSMSSVFSGLHHDISHGSSNNLGTPMLPPKLTPQNFTSPNPGAGNVVPSSIAAMALTPQRSLSPGRGPTDFSFGGNSNGSNSSGGSSGKRANRTRFTDYQIKVLQEFFENNAYPKDDDLEYLSKLLGLSPRVIVVWFQNARQKARKVYENQPAAEPVTPGGREGDDGSGRFQRTPGLNYQCKKCLLVFQRYYELIRHQKTHCFKEEDAKRSAQAQAAAAQVAAVLSSEDSNSSSTTTTNAVPNNPSTPALTDQLQRPLSTSTPPHIHQSLPSQLPSTPQSAPPAQSESKEGSFQCDKCNLMFGRFELWREHQLVHIMNPSLFPPAYPPDSPFGILQQQALNASTGITGDPPHPLIAMMQDRKRKFEDFEENTGSETRNNSEHSEQPKDKRLRTTILPEQLDYLYQKYQVESNPSRKMLETIAREVGLKKRVVQVWFQNTRARERKGQFRAHSQVINKRCPFCPALFKVKSALESHLSSKHADQVARGEVNIDNIPDEELSMESAPSNPSTPNMMPPLFPPFNSDVEASLKKYYEESMKRYISELQAHTSNGKQENSGSQVASGTGESPLDLSKPVDLSRPVKLNLGSLSNLLEEQQHSLSQHFRGGSDCGPLTDLSERSICDDDSMSETTEFLDDESGPASPASSTQSSRHGGTVTTPGMTSVSGGNAGSGNSTSGNTSGGKRYRTQMSATQVKVMKSLFSDYKTPTMAECEMLGREIGLPKRVVQVWFQNARAKEKKARLAAGLPAEGSAVQPHRGPTGPDECRLCSVRYTPKSPLQEHVFSRRHIESVRVAVEEGSLVPPTPGAPILPGGTGSSMTNPTTGQANTQSQNDENMMYGSLFLHPTAMFQAQQQHGTTASTATTTPGECLADLLDS